MARSTSLSLWGRVRARAWYLWGLSLCYSGVRSQERSFYSSGIAAFTHAIQLWPDFALAHYRRGLIRGRELGEYQAAISDLAEASTLRPEWAAPYLQRGLFHRFNHNPQAAINDLRRYVELAEAGYWRDEAERQIAILLQERAE